MRQKKKNRSKYVNCHSFYTLWFLLQRFFIFYLLFWSRFARAERDESDDSVIPVSSMVDPLPNDCLSQPGSREPFIPWIISDLDRHLLPSESGEKDNSRSSIFEKGAENGLSDRFSSISFPVISRYPSNFLSYIIAGTFAMVGGIWFFMSNVRWRSVKKGTRKSSVIEKGQDTTDGRSSDKFMLKLVSEQQIQEQQELQKQVEEGQQNPAFVERDDAVIEGTVQYKDKEEEWEELAQEIERVRWQKEGGFEEISIRQLPEFSTTVVVPQLKEDRFISDSRLRSSWVEKKMETVSFCDYNYVLFVCQLLAKEMEPVCQEAYSYPEYSSIIIQKYCLLFLLSEMFYTIREFLSACRQEGWQNNPHLNAAERCISFFDEKRKQFSSVLEMNRIREVCQALVDHFSKENEGDMNEQVTGFLVFLGTLEQIILKDSYYHRSLIDPFLVILNLMSSFEQILLLEPVDEEKGCLDRERAFLEVLIEIGSILYNKKKIFFSPRSEEADFCAFCIGISVYFNRGNGGGYDFSKFPVLPGALSRDFQYYRNRTSEKIADLSEKMRNVFFPSSCGGYKKGSGSHFYPCKSTFFTARLPYSDRGIPASRLLKLTRPDLSKLKN